MITWGDWGGGYEHEPPTILAQAETPSWLQNVAVIETVANKSAE